MQSLWLYIPINDIVPTQSGFLRKKQWLESLYQDAFEDIGSAQKEETGQKNPLDKFRDKIIEAIDSNKESIFMHIIRMGGKYRFLRDAKKALKDKEENKTQEYNLFYGQLLREEYQKLFESCLPAIQKLPCLEDEDKEGVSLITDIFDIIELVFDIEYFLDLPYAKDLMDYSDAKLSSFLEDPCIFVKVQMPEEWDDKNQPSVKVKEIKLLSPNYLYPIDSYCRRAPKFCFLPSPIKPIIEFRQEKFFEFSVDDINLKIKPSDAKIIADKFQNSQEETKAACHQQLSH